MAVDIGELVKFCIGLSSGKQTERKVFKMFWYFCIH